MKSRNLLIVIILFIISCTHLSSTNKMIKATDYTCYQIKDIRVYFSHTFMFGLMCHGDSIEQAKGISNYYYSRIEPLFKYNKITGEMLFNEWQRRKRAGFQPILNQLINPPKGEISINDELTSYKGRIVKIFRFSEYNYDSISTPNLASYYICCTPSIEEDGWGAQDLFLVKLKQKNLLKLIKTGMI